MFDPRFERSRQCFGETYWKVGSDVRSVRKFIIRGHKLRLQEKVGKG